VLLTLSACQSSEAGDADSGAAVQGAEASAVAGAHADSDPEAMQQQLAMVTELQSIDQVLSPLRTQALEDPEIQAEQARVVQQVEAAMESISPGIIEAQTRFETLRAEYGAAQQAGDQERLQSLAPELQTLQMSLQQTQSQAIEQEAVASALTAFRESMFDRMRALDPSADSLLTRAQDLSDALEAMAAEAAGGF
jgi:chromosome segregation ATPase